MNKHLYRLLTAVTFGGLLSLAGLARTLTVNPAGGADYTTLKAACAAAADGDTIVCAAGVYDSGIYNGGETGYTNKRAMLKGLSNVTVQGAGRGQSVVLGGVRTMGDKEQVGGILLQACTNVTISGFTFSGCYGWKNTKDSARSQGAGVLSVNGRDNAVVDCTFDDCQNEQGSAIAALRAAADVGVGCDGSLSAVRCLFSNCSTTYGNDGYVAWNVGLYYCVFTRMTSTPSKSTSEDAAMVVGSTLVNCSFANIWARRVLYKSKAYNTIFGHCTKHIGDKTGADGTAYLSSCCCSAKADEAYVQAGEDSATLFGQDDYQFKDMLNDDYRLVAGKPAVGNGNASYLALIPEGWRTMDFCGRIVDANGLINIGAAASAQSVVTPSAQFVSFVPADGDSQIVVNGATNEFTKAHYGETAWSSETKLYYYPEYPSMQHVRILSADGCWDWGMFGSGSDAITRYPEVSGEYAFMPPPYAHGAGLKLSHCLATSAQVYVDAASMATEPDGSEGNEFKNIQDAVDAIPAGSFGIVRVAAGTYATGGKKLTDVDIKSRVVLSGKNVRILGAGADRTFLVGEIDSSTEAEERAGCGPDAVRCLATDSKGQISGMTLTGGRTSFGSGSHQTQNAAVFGAAVYARHTFEVTDCIVSNNVSWRTFVIGADTSNRLFLKRCRIENNELLWSYHWAWYIATASSLWVNNWVSATAGSGRDGSVWGGYNSDDRGYIYDSTFYAPACEDSNGTMDFVGYIGGWDNTKAKCRNCLIVGSGTVKNITCYGTVVEEIIPDCTKTTYVTGLTGGISGKNILKFNDVATGDFRLRGTSEGATNAVWRADDSTSLAYIYTTSSLDGVEPDFTGTRMQPSGCYRRLVAAVTTDVAGVTPTEVYLAEGESATFTAAKMPLKHFTVNGVEQPQEPGTYSFIYTHPVDARTGVVAIGVVNDTDWYVDAENGSDVGHGTQTAPLRKLSDACTGCVSGDTVHVAEGTYDEGEMSPEKFFMSEKSFTVNSRVTVRSGVTVEAIGAVDRTFIVGAPSPNAPETGLAEGALRCATVLSGGTLRGFTLKDGHTSMQWNNGNGSGAGVIGDEDGLVEDCVITNCIGYVAAGHWGGTFNRCKFVNCDATNGNTPVGKFGRYYNCYFNHNRGGTPIGAAYALESCTVGEDNTTKYGTHDGDISGFQGAEIRNLLFLGRKITIAAQDVVFKSCFLTSDTTVSKADAASETQSWSFDANSRTDLARADLAVDAEGHPLLGSNAAIDAGNASLYDMAKSGTKDLDGNPRILNGNRIDVGCYEYDWRGEFARKLGRKVTVTDANAGVELTEEGVKIPADGMLAVAVATQIGKPYVFSADVADGVLSVLKEGELFAELTSDSDRSQSYGAVSDTTRFVFAQGNVGSSVLSHFHRGEGAVLIVR